MIKKKHSAVSIVFFGAPYSRLLSSALRSKSGRILVEIWEGIKEEAEERFGHWILKDTEEESGKNLGTERLELRSGSGMNLFQIRPQLFSQIKSQVPHRSTQADIPAIPDPS